MWVRGPPPAHKAYQGFPGIGPGAERSARGLFTNYLQTSGEATSITDHRPSLDPAATLAQAYCQVTGHTQGEAHQIVERYGLAYALKY